MLDGLRVLDLTNESGFLAGKVLGQFGADVIKIEQLGGDPARTIGPFYHDIEDPEKSLYWFAFNDSKRGITLNIQTPAGQNIFKKLASTADIVLETFPVGYMDSVGLGYKDLSAHNRELIMTSITPYGQTGPYNSYKSTELTAMAMGGMMSQTGYPDALPCRLDSEHAYCLAGSNAALATIIAYYYRECSGEGQHVDVSLFECVVRENYHEVPISWEFGKHNVKRNGTKVYRGRFFTRTLWPCKDGHVTWAIFGGKVGAIENKQLAEWISKEGISNDLTKINWDLFDFNEKTQKDIDFIENIVIKLMLSHTKKELESESIKRGIRLSVVSDVRDIYENRQLKFRNYWRTIKHDELGDVITYPGQLYLSDVATIEIRRRAPLIGEHNNEIYHEELGFDQPTLDRLKRNGII